MLASLVMSVAIPEAFGDRGMLFAGAYVVIQVGRHTFLTFASGRRGDDRARRAGRILIWFIAAGVFWLGGALVEGGRRARCCGSSRWRVDYTGPIFLYRVPGFRGSTTSCGRWTAAHFAERFQLFVIIALGESIVITGATATDLDLTPSGWSPSGWHSSPARPCGGCTSTTRRRWPNGGWRWPSGAPCSRDAYTYLHVVIVAGVIVAAVGDELVIAHPTDVLPDAEVAAIMAGPAIYLFATSLFRPPDGGDVVGQAAGGCAGLPGRRVDRHAHRRLGGARADGRRSSPR